ncbi:MAG: hypothetical protein IIC52_06165 [Proteobacteria bacterium]|nr:hypothetical protein [Pseudomonadota bacterium]
MNHIGNVTAPRSIAGAGFVRPDGGNSGNFYEGFADFEQEQEGAGDQGQGAAENPLSMGRGAGAPPDHPGLVVVRQLVGDGKSEESLGRLLDNLDGINLAGPEDQGPGAPSPPVARFTHASNMENPHHRAASAYQWGQQVLNSKNPLRPGVIYSGLF